jgi:macrodomain Ter protein organizer (MatP/YcbG family)
MEQEKRVAFRFDQRTWDRLTRISRELALSRSATVRFLINSNPQGKKDESKQEDAQNYDQLHF